MELIRGDVFWTCYFNAKCVKLHRELMSTRSNPVHLAAWECSL